MKLTIEVSDYSEDSLTQQIVEALATRAEEAIGEEIRRKVNATLNQIIIAKADEMVTEALTKPRSKCDQWGEQTGPAVTLAEYITAEFKRHMEQRVESDGRNADYNRGTPRKDWLIEQFAVKPIAKEVEVIITAIRQEAMDKAKMVVAELIASKLTK